jgi:hypothetical protein
VTDLGAVTCLGNDVADPAAVLADATPAPPKGFFYLVHEDFDEAEGIPWGHASDGAGQVIGSGGCP